MLNAADDKVKALLEAWHANDLMFWGPNINTSRPKHAHNRRKYTALDMGSSGQFLVDRMTEIVYSIKGYGVPNLKKPRGTVEFLTQFIKDCTARGQEYTHKYWYDLHPTTEVAPPPVDTKNPPLAF